MSSAYPLRTDAFLVTDSDTQHGRLAVSIETPGGHVLELRATLRKAGATFVEEGQPFAGDPARTSWQIDWLVGELAGAASE